MTELRWRIRRVDVTPSTNDDARLAAEAGEAEGLVVIAERQSAGRGRQGRVWESPAGNLYCSVLLRPRNMPQVAGLYSFVAALAVREAVVEALTEPSPSPWGGVRGGVDSAPLTLEYPEVGHSPRPPSVSPASGREAVVTLKWPNDVLVGGRKISGILLEVAGDVLIVGIGLNVAHYPADTLYPATSLKAEGRELPLSALLDSLLQSLAYWHDRMQSECFTPIRLAWLEHAQTGGLTVRLLHETVQGTFAGIDEAGRLRLLLEDGVERVISTGDVLFQSAGD